MPYIVSHLSWSDGVTRDFGVRSSQGRKFKSPDTNFDGLVHSGFCRPQKWTIRLNPPISWPYIELKKNQKTMPNC